jgi:hypothetical protein
MKNNRYLILTLFFLFLSLIGGVYLAKQNQNNQNFVYPTPTKAPITTKTLIPSRTLTSTPIKTPTPTKTLIPTKKPTNTPHPTATPKFIVESPSPTRILLPAAGINFPSQALTLLGGIVILLGFLILL